ncbi:peptidylprolyl isomerase [Nannocystaceae bacterium ST9]
MAGVDLRRLFAACLLATFGCTPPPKVEQHEQVDASTQTRPETKPRAKSPQPELAPLPHVVARVEGHDILRAEFDARYEPEAARILARRTDGKVPTPYQAVQRETILDKLIWSKLLELEAERSGIDFTAEALAKLEADERRHIRDWPAWLDRVGQSVEIRHQANVDYLRERALLESRVGPLAPSEAELLAFYEANADKFVAREEMVRASHLLLTYGPRVGDEKIQPILPDDWKAATPEQQAEWDAAAKARAIALRERALTPGVDFNELAREVSEGPGAFRGEDMGLFPRKQMVPEYAEVAFALEPGQIGEPIKSDKGYYVIKSFGRYPAGPLPFEAVRPDLVRQLESEKFKRAHAALKTELEGRFTVVSEPLDQARAFRAERDARKRGGQ